MSHRRIVLLCGATGFAFWLVSLLGYGGLLIWCMCAAGVSIAMAWVVLRIRRRRHWSIYGPELRFAMSVLSSRNRWADLAEILNLSVDADLRRSRSARAVAVVVGLTREERRAVRYIPAIAEMREAPYGMAVTVLGAPGQSWEVWQRHCGQLSSALRVREVTVAEPRAGIFELALRVRDPLGTPILLATPQMARGWEIPCLLYTSPSPRDRS